MQRKKRIQISESIPCGILLALSGGCMDAYSYLFRDGVFANAQTGNMLLFGVNLAHGNWAEMRVYMWPIMAFIAGIALSDLIKIKVKYRPTSYHWRQLVVLVEIIILAGVAFISPDHNTVANSLISFACGAQVEGFRKIHGNSIATTMCIGNLRSGTDNLNHYWATRDPKWLQKSFLYYGIILCFIIGAIMESLLIERCGEYAILLSVVLLIGAMVFMALDKKDTKKDSIADFEDR